MSLLVIESLDTLNDKWESYNPPIKITTNHQGDEVSNEKDIEDVKTTLHLINHNRGTLHLNSDKSRDTWVYNVGWKEDNSWGEDVSTFFRGAKVFNDHLIFVGDIPEEVVVKAKSQFGGSHIVII